MPAMRPVSVSIPVAVTTIVPRPRVTGVFMKTTVVRSASGASAATEPPADFRHGVRLTSQRGLLHLQGRRREQPSVGRHPVAGLDLDNIAGHQLVGIQLEAASSPGGRLR